MKRVLLLVASLAIALALLWILARRAGAPPPILPSTVDAASPAQSASASLSAESAPAPASLEGATVGASTRVQEATDISNGLEQLPGPKAAVQGRVVKVHTQEPVNGGEARLFFVLPGEENQQPYSRTQNTSHVMLTTKLDAEGHFRFTLPVGTRLHQMIVTPPVPLDDDFRRGGSDASILFAVHQLQLHEQVGEAGVELVVEVEGTSELHGLARDAETFAPLEGVRLRIVGNGALVPDVDSSADGRFTLAGISPKAVDARWSLRADRRDYLACVVPLESAQLAEGAPPLFVDLSRGLAIAGSVVDAQKHPISGVSLHFRAVGFEKGVDFGASVFAMRTDEHGDFRYAPVPPCSSLSVELQAQRIDGRELLPLTRDLGPLRTDRTDLQLEVQGSGLLEVRAQLVDGTAIDPREFQVVCTNAQSIEPAGVNADALLLRVPLGVELALEAYANGKDMQDSHVYVRGHATARLDGTLAQSEIRIVLGERGNFRAPPPKNDARELVLPDEAFLQATVDLQLVDANTGAPIEAGHHVSISGAGGSLSSTKLENGWVRVRGRPGKHVLEAEIDGGAHESFELTIPASGYGTAQWRLKAGP